MSSREKSILWEDRLTFYELRWFMDHPFYITMVLTVIADHTLLVPKSEKNTRGDQQPKPKKKPKPSSFLKEDYSQHLQEMVELLAKQLVFMSRRPRQQGKCFDCNSYY